MNTVNVSRPTGWICVWLSIACFGALAWAFYEFVRWHESVNWAPAGLGDIYAPAMLVLLVVTFLFAIVGIISGTLGVRSPGNARGWVLNAALAVLLALVVWAGYYTLTNVPHLV